MVPVTFGVRTILDMSLVSVSSATVRPLTLTFTTLVMIITIIPVISGSLSLRKSTQFSSILFSATIDLTSSSDIKTLSDVANAAFCATLFKESQPGANKRPTPSRFRTVTLTTLNRNGGGIERKFALP